MKRFKSERWGFLKEGKVINYLKYAAGEIVLVVIGILIALQVNNWNTARAERRSEHAYLIRLKEELNKNVASLAFSKALTQVRKDQVTLLLSVSDTSSFSTAQKEKILESIEKVTWRSYMPISRIVYKELQSSGNMTLLQSNALREQLAAYYDEVDHWELVLQSTGPQDAFSRATAGLLTPYIYTDIEKVESMNDTLPTGPVHINMDPAKMQSIIDKFASDREAKKWLPKIYHYHIVSGKVIDHLEELSKALITTVNQQINTF